MRNQRAQGRADQRGMASIIITMATMVVISLIVISFAVVSQREQRKSLDQLQSSQAFYAAESGIEDARAVIQAAVRAGQPVPSKTDCTTNNGGNYPTGNQTFVDQESNVRYTCLRVDPAPTSLNFDGVAQDSIVVPMTAAQPITSVRVTWTPTTPTGSPMSGCPAAAPNSFRPQTGWTCGHGVLRADLVPTGGALQSATLSSGLLSGFFVPVTSGSTGQLSYANAGRANVVAADCSAGNSCTAIINNISGGSRSVSLRLSSMYQSSNMVIEGLNGSNVQGITGVQAVIDSTGKATDVLRRIQVRYPVVQTGGLLPGAAITSNGAICKRFSVSPTYFSIPNDIVDADSQNAMCQTRTVSTAPAPCTAINEIVFTLDSSGSMATAWDGGTRDAALRSLTRNFIQGSDISAAENHAAIVSFNTTGTLNQGLTGSQPALLNAVNTMQNNTGTNYQSGLTQAQQEFNSTRVRPGAGKIMVFISDGVPDNSTGSGPASTAERNQMRNMANIMKAQGVRIYTIGIGEPSDPVRTLDEQLLTDMAGNGGSYTDARNRSQMQAILDQISNSVTCT